MDKHYWPGGLHHLIAQQHGPLLYGPLDKQTGDPLNPTVILSGSYGALVNAEILRLAQREADLQWAIDNMENQLFVTQQERDAHKTALAQAEHRLDIQARTIRALAEAAIANPIEPSGLRDRVTEMEKRLELLESWGSEHDDWHRDPCDRRMPVFPGSDRANPIDAEPAGRVGLFVPRSGGAALQPQDRLAGGCGREALKLSMDNPEGAEGSAEEDGKEPEG